MRTGIELRVEQSLRQRWRSRWIASCLPEAERALRKAPRLVEAVDRAEGLRRHRSVMDATVVCVFPELRDSLAAFYAGQGLPLAALRDAAALARLDERLVGFIALVEQVSTDTGIDTLLRAVQARTWPA